IGKGERDMMAIGTATWQELQRVITAGRGEFGRLPRGAASLGASPTGEPNQLPEEWRTDVSHASHVVYHYGTPVAWVDSRDGGWGSVPYGGAKPAPGGVAAGCFQRLARRLPLRHAGRRGRQPGRRVGCARREVQRVHVRVSEPDPGGADGLPGGPGGLIR